MSKNTNQQSNGILLFCFSLMVKARDSSRSSSDLYFYKDGLYTVRAFRAPWSGRNRASTWLDPFLSLKPLWARIIEYKQTKHQTMPLRSCGRWGFGITGPFSSLRQAPGRFIYLCSQYLFLYYPCPQVLQLSSTNKCTFIILVFIIGWVCLPWVLPLGQREGIVVLDAECSRVCRVSSPALRHY